MIKFDEEIFSNNEEEFAKISLDDCNQVSMTRSTKKAVNFDKVKTKYLSNNSFSNDKLKSCDALFSHHMGHTLIEFKNGKFCINEVRIKIADSLLIIEDIKKVNIVSIAKKEIEFVFVYNEVVNAGRITASQNKIHSHLQGLAKMEYIYFDLERYKGVYFKDVHTYTAAEFDTYIENL